MRLKKERPICPKCNNKYIYARLKTNDFWCRQCNYIGSRRMFFKKVRKKQTQKVV